MTLGESLTRHDQLAPGANCVLLPLLMHDGSLGGGTQAVIVHQQRQQHPAGTSGCKPSKPGSSAGYEGEQQAVNTVNTSATNMLTSGRNRQAAAMHSDQADKPQQSTVVLSSLADWLSRWC
jgi:hypothetical protein